MRLVVPAHRQVPSGVHDHQQVRLVVASPVNGAIGGGRPSSGQLNDFLDIRPSTGAGRPSTLPASRPGSSTGAIVGGAAAADFLRNTGTRPSTRPAEDAGRLNRPGVADRLTSRIDRESKIVRSLIDLESKTDRLLIGRALKIDRLLIDR